MKTVEPGIRFNAACVSFASGLVGTVGVRIVDENGVDVTGRTTNQIIEEPPGSALYFANLLSPVDKGQYQIRWDNGGTPPLIAREDLLVDTDVDRSAVAPGSTVDSIARGFVTGLVGQIGVRVINENGVTVLPRTTAGIDEWTINSGVYETTIVAPDTPGYYSIIWDDGSVTPTTIAAEDFEVAIYSPILASLDDINANLDGEVIFGTPANTQLLQISVARIVRGYLSRIYDRTTLLSWNSPVNTPDIINEVAGKLIASQLYYNKISSQTSNIPTDNLGQRLYDEAMSILKDIVSGEQVIPDVTTTLETTMSDLDFFPNDSTDRAFTLNLQL